MKSVVCFGDSNTYGHNPVNGERLPESVRWPCLLQGLLGDGYKVIEEGDFITIDMGGIVGGYCGDMTRTVAVGGVSEEQAVVYETVLASQLAGLEALAPGVRCFDVDKICRDIIADAGYGEFFIHGTGHGVGREVHESPTLNTKSDEVLEENMPVTVEPGIYIPDKFGVRIEDLAIITGFGIINTNRSPKELIIL